MEWHKVEPINSPRIYEEIVRQIRTLISEGKLKSGDRLPPERDLAERFRVSRASVREALRALGSMGLIEIRLGEGTFVREISVDSLIEPLALVILTQREAVGELFEARRLLEPPIAGLAARRSTKEEIQEMERILEEQRSHQDHLRILEAIRGRRAAAARRAMLDHVVAVETLVMGRQQNARKLNAAKKPRR